MKKNITIILLILLAFSACDVRSNHNKVSIDTLDSSKIIIAEISYTDTIKFEVPVNTPDSVILASIKHTTDSLKRDSVRRDSLQLINFRKITRKINGGYNGLADRERIYKKAKEVLR